MIWRGAMRGLNLSSASSNDGGATSTVGCSTSSLFTASSGGVIRSKYEKRTRPLLTRSYKLLLARRKNAIRSPCSSKSSNGRCSALARITPAHAALSNALTKNAPRCPLVPLESPTVSPPICGAKSRSRSARKATSSAASLLMPAVLKVLKLSIIVRLSTVGSDRQSVRSCPAQRSR